MRLDKYLKVSRIIKRRTIAKELLDLKRAKINDKFAKPSSEVKIDDFIEIELKDKRIYFKVLCLDSKDSDSMFELIKEEKIIREL